ncbi:MAG TPA: hypothetical protein VLX28_28565, partial [Thermoanaerobaculia bacterium]|nr:hypothetical protein [Thermoanaerobaculia bacterium]
PSVDQAEHKKERHLSDDADNKNQPKGASGFASSAQTNKMSSTDPEINDQKNTAESKRERFTKKLEGFSSVFEFAVAAAAVVGVLLVIIQIRYLGKSDQLSRDALHLTRENNASSDKTAAQILARMEASNKLSADAMKESQRQAAASLKESERLNLLTSDMVAQAKRQAALTAKAIDESSAQAKANREFFEAQSAAIRATTEEQARINRMAAEAQAKAARDMKKEHWPPARKRSVSALARKSRPSVSAALENTAWSCFRAGVPRFLRS